MLVHRRRAARHLEITVQEGRPDGEGTAARALAERKVTDRRALRCTTPDREIRESTLRIAGARRPW
jgi:hypothetical protein